MTRRVGEPDPQTLLLQNRGLGGGPLRSLGGAGSLAKRVCELVKRVDSYGQKVVGTRVEELNTPASGWTEAAAR